MKQEFRGVSKIFSFTLRQHVQGKGYKVSTAVLSLACLVLPALIMILITVLGGGEESLPAYEVAAISRIVVVDDEGKQEDYAVLNTLEDPDFSNISYETAASVEEAAELTRGSEGALILFAKADAMSVTLHVLVPEDSSLTEDDAAHYQQFLDWAYSAVQVEKSGLDEMQLMDLATPVHTEIITGETEEVDNLASMREILSMLLPYAVIMVLYFMILAYGQGVANCVLMEKTSKLVDTLLVTVRPSAMMLGKVLAIALSGVMQLFIWVACLVVSFAVGTAAVTALEPETDMLLIQLFRMFGEAGGLFTVPGIILSVLMILSGFLLYCSLAAIGGSMASKPEDLSNTNVVFTLALVVSFFAVLYGSTMGGGDYTWGGSGYTWQLYVPFTAMLVVPSEVLLGEISILTACISLGIMLVSTGIMIVLAGKVYRLLILRKGAPLSPGKLVKLLQGKAIES